MPTRLFKWYFNVFFLYRAGVKVDLWNIDDMIHDLVNSKHISETKAIKIEIIKENYLCLKIIFLLQNNFLLTKQCFTNDTYDKTLQRIKKKIQW